MQSQERHLLICRSKPNSPAVKAVAEVADEIATAATDPIPTPHFPKENQQLQQVLHLHLELLQLLHEL